MDWWLPRRAPLRGRDAISGVERAEALKQEWDARSAEWLLRPEQQAAAAAGEEPAGEEPTAEEPVFTIGGGTAAPAAGDSLLRAAAPAGTGELDPRARQQISCCRQTRLHFGRAMLQVRPRVCSPLVLPPLSAHAPRSSLLKAAWRCHSTSGRSGSWWSTTR